MEIQPASTETIDRLLAEIAGCTACAAELPHGVRPVIQASSTARLLIAGQAPGSKVHLSGVPFSDRSGDRLREWTGLSADQFYDADRVAIVPMGFCYPGRAAAGDAPPRPEWGRARSRSASAIFVTSSRSISRCHIPRGVRKSGCGAIPGSKSRCFRSYGAASHRRCRWQADERRGKSHGLHDRSLHKAG